MFYNVSWDLEGRKTEAYCSHEDIIGSAKFSNQLTTKRQQGPLTWRSFHGGALDSIRDGGGKDPGVLAELSETARHVIREVVFAILPDRLRTGSDLLVPDPSIVVERLLSHVFARHSSSTLPIRSTLLPGIASDGAFLNLTDKLQD